MYVQSSGPQQEKYFFLCSCTHAFEVFIEKNVIWSNNRSYLFKADRWSRQYKAKKSHMCHSLFAYFLSRVLRVLFVLGLETRQHCKVPTDRARKTELRIGCAFDPQTISSRTIETKQRQRRVRRKCVRWSCVTGRLPQKDTGPWNPVSSCECVQGKRETKQKINLRKKFFFPAVEIFSYCASFMSQCSGKINGAWQKKYYLPTAITNAIFFSASANKKLFTP